MFSFYDDDEIYFICFFAKLSSSPVQVQSNLNWDLALNLVITTHPHPPPPGKVEMQFEIDHIYSQ